MSTPSAEELNDALVGFDRLYGLEFVEFSDTEVRAKVAVREEIKQPVGLVHGGYMHRLPSRSPRSRPQRR